MSSIRVESMAISKGDLDILDEFMFSIGCELYPGANSKSEPANMPWSTRWYRPETAVLTNGNRGNLYFTVDIAQFLNQHLEVKND